MKKAFSLIVFCVLLSLTVRSQEFIYGPTVSYQYQKGSTMKLGGMLMKGVGINSILRADVTGNLTWTQHKFAIIPELAVSYYPGNTSTLNLVPLFVRGEFTPYTVVPKIGISILTLIEIDLGYGISINDKSDYKPLKGFTGSLRFSIPLNM